MLDLSLITIVCVQLNVAPNAFGVTGLFDISSFPKEEYISKSRHICFLQFKGQESVTPSPPSISKNIEGPHSPWSKSISCKISVLNETHLGYTGDGSCFSSKLSSKEHFGKQNSVNTSFPPRKHSTSKEDILLWVLSYFKRLWVMDIHTVFYCCIKESILRAGRW